MQSGASAPGIHALLPGEDCVFTLENRSDGGPVEDQQCVITPDDPGNDKLVRDLHTMNGSWLFKQGAAVLERHVTLYE